MHKIIRIFVWGLVAIVILVAGLLAYLRNADLSAYQGHIESFVSSRIGHTLEIGGRFELHLGRTTIVIAEDVALYNSEWPENPELISVGNVTLSFNTWSLLSQPFIIEKLDARNIKAFLARDEAGKLNWVADLPAKPDAASDGFDPNRIAFRMVNIEDIDFVYADPARPRPIRALLDQISVSPDAEDVLDLDIDGEINDLPLRADGKLGPWQNFIDGRDIKADLDVTLGDLQLMLEGAVVDLVRLQGVEFSADLTGPDIARVLERLALPPFAGGAFQVTADIQRVDSGHKLRLQGNLGDIEVFAMGDLDSLLRPQRVAHEFSITGPDAHHVAELFGFRNVPAAAFRISGEYSRVGHELTFADTLLSIGENSVQFSGDIDLASPVPDWDLRISASGPDFSVAGPFLKVAGLPQEPFTIDGHIRKEDSIWLAEAVQTVVGENRLTIDGQLEAGSRGATRISIKATGPDISFIQDFTGIEGIPVRPYDISATIRPDPLGIKVDDGLGIFGDNRVGIDGVVVLQSGLDGSVLDVFVAGPEFGNLAPLAGVPNVPTGAFDAHGRVEFHGQRIQLNDVEVTVGELQGAASGEVSIKGPAAGNFDLQVSIAGSDMRLLGGFEALQAYAEDSFSVAGNIRHQGGTLSATDLRVALGNMRAQMKGSVIREGQLADITIAASAPDSGILRKLAGVDYLPAGRVVVDGRVEKSATEIKFTDWRLGVGDLRLAADGAVNLTPLENDSDLKFDISGASLFEAGRIFGSETLPEKPFSVAGQFVGTPSGFAVTNFLAQVGDSDLVGEFHANLRDKPKIGGRLVSTHLDLTDRIPARDEAQSSQTDPAASDKFVFSEDQLQSSWLQAADVDIDLQIEELITNVMRVTDVHVRGELQDGALSIDPIQLHDEFGEIKSNFYLVPEDGSYAMRAVMYVENLRTGLSATRGQDRSTLPPISGRLELAGTGNSLHTIMASSNGVVSFRQGSGTVKEVFGSAIFKDVLLQVLRTLNPMRRERDYQILECGIYEVSIVDGRATIDTFAMQTDTMTTVASGTVNFKNEKLDIAFRAKPREGLGITLGTVANQLLEVRGTLKSPRIAVDAGKTATTTGAAVATGGLSLLARGLWDRLSAEADICKESGKAD